LQEYAYDAPDAEFTPPVCRYILYGFTMVGGDLKSIQHLPQSN
jgi:hypothetical protein